MATSCAVPYPDEQTPVIEGMISADSHVIEPPSCYKDYIDPAFREDAPYLEYDEEKGDRYVIKGFKEKISVARTASADLDLDARPPGRPFAVRFEDLHRGGFDPSARLADQDQDGIVAEVLYPTVGMVLCGLSDHAYQKACMDAYNRWLQDYISVAPDRLFGIGQTPVRTVEEAIADFHAIKAMGFKGVMMPGDPGTVEDYDHPVYDPLWQTAVELDLPISFHILTGGSRDKRDSMASLQAQRGPMLGVAMSVGRGLQDIVAMFIFGGVFERNPRLKLVLVESDASWAPHWMHRADHAYSHLRKVVNFPDMSLSPGEYFRENVYLTFGDDWPAFRSLDMLNPHRLLWANDFPHTDSIWPCSQQLLRKHSEGLSDAQKGLILRDNVSELYGLGIHRQ